MTKMQQTPHKSGLGHRAPRTPRGSAAALPTRRRGPRERAVESAPACRQLLAEGGPLRDLCSDASSVGTEAHCCTEARRQDTSACTHAVARMHEGAVRVPPGELLTALFIMATLHLDRRRSGRLGAVGVGNVSSGGQWRNERRGRG